MVAAACGAARRGRKATMADCTLAASRRVAERTGAARRRSWTVLAEVGRTAWTGRMMVTVMQRACNRMGDGAKV
ncbi:growth inhibitor PemK, partial [Sesbania bispinosa]